MTKERPDNTARWERACLARAVFLTDPTGCGGLWLRARSGPVRDAFLGPMAAMPLPLRRIAPTIGDDALFGGLDLAATLEAGRQIRTAGLAASPCVFVLSMAERAGSGLACRIGRLLDRETHAVVALDEGADGDEIPPTALTERMGLFVDLDMIAVGETNTGRIAPEKIAAAQRLLPDVAVTPAHTEELVQVAAQLGIASLRAPLFAKRVARVICALSGRISIESEDLLQAVGLVLAHRAQVSAIMVDEQDESQPEPPEPGENEPSSSEDATEPLPAEILLEAAKAALPPGLLEQLAAGRASRARSGASGTGAVRKGNRRGRPLPSRPGRLDGQSHIDLVATLRAAAPWQPVRRASSPKGHLVHIRPADIRVKRYEEKSDRILIFAVDASGSAAMARLAEAKGAVELLLGEAYARRDHVALVSFRGSEAEVLLPPTRSLVQTKRRLAGLPGGGGTPLAAGLQAAMQLAAQSRSRGMTPSIAILTDGRANIALDGTANRQAAAADIETIAKQLRADATPSLVIDMGVRPQPTLKTLADLLDGPYIPLPRADAARLSQAVSASLAD